jgi:DNA-binding transcriptional LysR family regulator
MNLEDYPGNLLEHLGTLRTVASHLRERGAFFRAAQKLHVDESVVRRRLSTLTGHVRSPLFEGRGQTLVLSREGEKVLDAANRAFAVLEALGEPEAPRLAFGCTGTVANELLPAVVSALQKSHPTLVVHVRRVGAEAALASVRAGDLDLAVVRSALQPKGVQSRFVSSDRVHLALPARHPLVGEPVRPERLAQEPLITFTPSSSTRARIMKVLGPLGAVARIEVESRAIALRYVELGMGIAFVSVLPGARVEAPGVVLKDVTRLFEGVSFWAVWKEGRALTPWEKEAVARLRAPG